MGNIDGTDPPTSDVEIERLERLRSYDILDTSQEETFANLTELAAQTLDFPIVLVSLVDEERLWFKTNHGIDFREVEREASLCNAVVCEENSVHLPATLDDPVASENSLVQNKGVRSYHGAPLVDEDGYVLGTFCLLDSKERELTNNEKDQLAVFADEAMDKIELKRSRKQKQEYAEDKELLLQELHHRVKNNFQVIMGLINMKKRNMTQSRGMKELSDIQGRIGSMSLIHELLYEAENFTDLDPYEYFNDLFSQISESYTGDCNNIHFDLSVEIGTLDVDQLTHCGLIINEWISNVLEHAFEPGEAGRISLEFFNDRDSYHLRISDDGKEIDGELEWENDETLGLKLIKRLAEEQLDGEMSLNRTDRTEFNVVF